MGYTLSSKTGKRKKNVKKGFHSSKGQSFYQTKWNFLGKIALVFCGEQERKGEKDGGGKKWQKFSKSVISGDPNKVGGMNEAMSYLN